MKKRVCKICGKGFIPKNSGNVGIYCSKMCYGESRRNTKQEHSVIQKMIRTKRLRGGYKIKHCEVCGKEMELNPYWFEIRRTCSRKCAGVLNSRRLVEMWKNPPIDMINKIRAKMIERRSKGRLEKETKPEKIFREELEKRGIVFEAQFGFGGIMVADFFIPSIQAFIFCDGEYWHSLPGATEKDWQQVEYVRSKGMKAFRFTDKEIYRSVKKCVDTVLENSPQPFKFAHVIDRMTILAIKSEMTTGETLKQVLKDYRRVEHVVLSGMAFYKISETEKVLSLIKDLCTTNAKIFYYVDKVQNNIHSIEDAKSLQELNSKRASITNEMNAYFGDEKDIKV